MAKNNKVNNNKKKNINNVKNKKEEVKEQETKTMKIFITIGVIIFIGCLIYICYHFFVEENNIGINMSTDKQLVYITIDGEDVLTTTQKYVSDLGYSMRYDINNFRVFKYKDKDVFKNLDSESILLTVEESSIPSNCEQTDVNTIYSSCNIIIDDYKEEYYVYKSDVVLKITIYTLGSFYTPTDVLDLIDYMLDTFEITE